jgi:hypothetical protein
MTRSHYCHPALLALAEALGPGSLDAGEILGAYYARRVDALRSMLLDLATSPHYPARVQEAAAAALAEAEAGY